MKLELALLVMLCSACSTASPRVELLGGMRNFDDSSNWQNTDNQNGVGIQFTTAEEDSMGLEVGYIRCQDASENSNFPFRLDNTKSTTEELYLGLRRNWPLGDSWQLTTSAGVSANFLKADFDLAYGGNAKSDSVAYTPYGQVGVNYLFDEHWALGLLYRRTFWGEDNSDVIDRRTTDNNTFLLSVGYGF